MDADFYAANRRRFFRQMEEGSLLLLFSGTPVPQSADSCYPFYVNRNFYYMTGVNAAGAVLLMAKNSSAPRETLFIPDPENASPGADNYPLAAREAAELSGVSDILFTESFIPRLQDLLTGTCRGGACRQDIATVYADMERRAFDSAPGDGGAFVQKLRERYPYLRFADAYRIIAGYRRVKAPGEIAEIRRAVDITERGIRAILKACRGAENECELEAAFRFEGHRSNQRPCAFPPIIACGKNAMMGHYSANCRPLIGGELIQLDVGWTSGLYCADISRAIPASGAFSPEQARLYQAVLDGHRRNIALLRPGITMKQHIDECAPVMREALAGIGYTDRACPGRKLFGGMNHYIGLDVHDVGSYASPLEPGMVVTIDSSVAIPSQGLSFRLEDDLLITEGGYENLSAGIPIEIQELEALLRGD